MKRHWTRNAVVGTAVAAAALVAFAAPASAAAPPSHGLSAAAAASADAALRAGTASKSLGVDSICASNHLTCQFSRLTTKKGSHTAVSSFYFEPGYGAEDLQQAYGLTSARGGYGTVALIETGYYPSLEADMNIYREANGIADCTSRSGCLRVVNMHGGSHLDTKIPYKGETFASEISAEETSLDVDMVSAACPRCHVLVVDLPQKDLFFHSSVASQDSQYNDFATGVRSAVADGANGVSLSYGLNSNAYSESGAVAAAFHQRGVAITASTGDGGVEGSRAAWPQSLPTVIAAGGTSLYQSNATHSGFSQTAWTDAGSSCDVDLPPAVGQPASVSSACEGHRATGDLSSDSDPFTGVSVYNSFSPFFGEPLGFTVFGGTSAAAPFLAAANVRAGVDPSTVGPNQLYKAAPGTITDVKTGSNASPGECPYFDLRVCNAGLGWDGPTGLGTPYGLGAFN